MRAILAFGLALILSAFPASRPLVAEDGQLSNAFVAPLMRWVLLHTPSPVDHLPRVVVSREAMMEKIGHPMRQSAMARALYVPEEVVIDDAFWNAEDTRTISFLVHELVHHAQLYNGVAYACNKAKEVDAYRLQNLWLQEQGLPPAVTDAWIAEMANCGETRTAPRA